MFDLKNEQKALLKALGAGTLAMGSIMGARAAQRPNVLFIAVDDLRPELNCYGATHIHSPNIDKLAQSGIQFDRAYCQVPVCGASRASLLTGLRPAANRFTDFDTRADVDAADVTHLPELFKNSGYHSVALGKIYHHSDDNETRSWSEGTSYTPPAPTYAQDPGDSRPAYEKAAVRDSYYRDGKLADHAVEKLAELKSKSKPFFLGVGFFKPHLPFVAPEKYWNMYDFSNISMPENRSKVPNTPARAYKTGHELFKNYTGVSWNLSDEKARTLIHAYYACVSYVDAQIGKLIDELDRLGLRNNTIVVLWGDHGWNLGEHSTWCKHALWEHTLQVPLIVSGPGISPGTRTDALVELIDIYPTLCDMAAVAKPDHLHGISMQPLFEHPEYAWKTGVFSRWKHGGESIMTDQYHYVAWDRANNGHMLYDVSTDPLEMVNIAHDNAAITNELLGRLPWSLDVVMDGSGGGENLNPQPHFTLSSSVGVAPLSVDFDASGSSDSDGSITGYAWDFDGDGTGDANGMTASHTFTGAGQYTVRLTITDNEGARASTTTTVSVRQELNITPQSVPGPIDAEDFDDGGEGVGYHDSDTTNEGGVYRAGGVDIDTVQSGGYCIGWTADGEWLAYTLDAAQSGTYACSLRVAGKNGGSAHLELNGQDVTGPVTIPATGEWQSWETVSAGEIELTSGQHTLRVAIDQEGWNLDRIIFDTAADDVSAGNYEPFSGAENVLNSRIHANIAEVEYNVAKHSFVAIDLYAVSGAHIGTIVSKYHIPGKYTARFPVKDLAGGLYILRGRVGNTRRARCLTLK